MHVRAIDRGETHAGIVNIFDDHKLIEEYLRTPVHKLIFPIFQVFSLVCIYLETI